MLKEFKQFIMRGNVMDMAVGVIIGAAFKAIVDALIGSFIQPLIQLLTGGMKTDEAGNIVMGGIAEINGVAFNWGAFLSAVVNFLILAVILFFLIKAVNKAMTVGKKKEEPAAPAAPTTKICPFCKSEIPVEATRCAHCTSELPAEEA